MIARRSATVKTLAQDIYLFTRAFRRKAFLQLRLKRAYCSRIRVVILSVVLSI